MSRRTEKVSDVLAMIVIAAMLAALGYAVFTGKVQAWFL